jgi:hypothetical protein
VGEAVGRGREGQPGAQDDAGEDAAEALLEDGGVEKTAAEVRGMGGAGSGHGGFGLEGLDVADGALEGGEEVRLDEGRVGWVFGFGDALEVLVLEVREFEQRDDDVAFAELEGELREDALSGTENGGGVLVCGARSLTLSAISFRVMTSPLFIGGARQPSKAAKLVRAGGRMWPFL